MDENYTSTFPIFRMFGLCEKIHHFGNTEKIILIKFVNILFNCIFDEKKKKYTTIVYPN